MCYANSVRDGNRNMKVRFARTGRREFGYLLAVADNHECHLDGYC
jgi:hypothetical protein